MPAKKTLNPRRLTKKQVRDLIASGAIRRKDLADRVPRICQDVFELPEDQFLAVLNIFGLEGKGDIYPGEYFRRFVRWCERVDEDARHGRQSSVSHWRFYSKNDCRLIDRIDDLIGELASGLDLRPDDLDKSYPSLDVVSQRVEELGVERVQETLYDPLVAYVGEILRKRDGDALWKIDLIQLPHYPYVLSKTRGVLMPINVVWSSLNDIDPPRFRKETADEFRRAAAERIFR
jgi:hypothetical protein